MPHASPQRCPPNRGKASLVLGNYASSSGGGAHQPTSEYNCVIVSNSTSTLSGVGGISVMQAHNCIIFYNTNANALGTSGNYTAGTLTYCCTTPKPFVGGGNITNAPLFVNPAAGNFQLQSGSPCINAGNNSSTVGNIFDLQGNPRIVAGTVDIGAYEYQTPTSALSYAWAQQYGFPTDSSADLTDPDGDGMSNYGEWRSDTVPTNSLSVLRIVDITNTASGIKVTWNCVSSRIYYMERATNLDGPSPFQNINNFLGGSSSPTRSYTDTTATNGGPYFYRVGVQ